jgi:hypothetical protein
VNGQKIHRCPSLVKLENTLSAVISLYSAQMQSFSCRFPLSGLTSTTHIVVTIFPHDEQAIAALVWNNA